MIPKECKRLAEVDFPIAVVSKHSAREKSIRHGHPSTLHLWWARRPLAACRAMLMALLLPDPCDAQCPEEFKRETRRVLREFRAGPARWAEEAKADEGLRKILLEFIGDFADWDHAANAVYVRAARELVKAAHPDDAPVVVDPFAGGGSIPLEALRLGCDTLASDLNPVACLIQRVMLEDAPREGVGFAEKIRQAGAEIQAAAFKEFVEIFPRDSDGATPATYIWAKTIRCESPSCGAEIPLSRSFWLCKKASRRVALRYAVARPEGKMPRVEFEVFDPRSESEVPAPTVSRARATCPCCGITLPASRVSAQLHAQNGGSDPVFDSAGHRRSGARLLAVVTIRKGIAGREYRAPTAVDYAAVGLAQRRHEAVLKDWEAAGSVHPCPLPLEPRPPSGADRVRRYGVLRFIDLTTKRQALSLHWLAERIRCIKDRRLADAMAMALGRCVDYWSASAVWANGGEFVAHTFGMQVIPIGWDFPEAVPWADASGNFAGAVDWVARVIERLETLPSSGHTRLGDACRSMLPRESAQVWFTDPPYYDAVRYSDLSDSFYVWLRRALPVEVLPADPFDPANPLTPKCPEVVQDELKRSSDGRAKDKTFFEDRMALAFEEGRLTLQENGVGSVVFAHKTTEGWESLLTGLIRARWTITGSWPIATERPGRLRSQNSAALETSIHLVVRPRAAEAPVGDWGDVLRQLPRRVAEWMERLQAEGVRGADLVFACIGPALEIYSRYSKVETAEGRAVPLDEYLLKVWEVVGRSALQQVLGSAEASARNGAAGALEEDARLTALFLWTLQATAATEDVADGNDESEDADSDDEDEESGGGKKKKGFSLIYDVARRFAQPLGIHMEAWEGRIIQTEKGVVRLLPVLERAHQLFGEEGAGAIADRIERSPTAAAAAQMALFPEPVAPPRVRGRGRGRRANVADSDLATRREATTLDRVHAAMLLQASGRANALRALLKAEIERSPDFLRLANALSALYPAGSDEKRLVDAMLLAVPR